MATLIRTGCIVTGLCLICIGPAPGAESVGDDEYLRMITDEVEQVQTEAGNLPGHLPIGLQASAFEDALERDFPTVYLLYRSLSNNNQVRVFEYYKSHNDVKEIQNYIAGLLAS